MGIPAHQYINILGNNVSNYRRNFTKNGIYFFTVVLENRQNGLLTEYIDEFRSAYSETQRFYPFETIAICVLPDHFHLIMKLPENDDNYSLRIKSIKYNFAKRLSKELKNPNMSKQGKRETGIWQRRFWEHLIRNDADLSRHMDYIYYNPVKHGYTQNVQDWKYSSFHRDVIRGIYPKDWGNNVVPAIQNLYME